MSEETSIPCRVCGKDAAENWLDCRAHFVRDLRAANDERDALGRHIDRVVAERDQARAQVKALREALESAQLGLRAIIESPGARHHDTTASIALDNSEHALAATEPA